MSSWERSRYIPWDRIPQDGTDLDHKKEKIFRDLQREAIEDELLQQQSPGQAVMVGDNSLATDKNASSNKIPYSHTDLLRQAAFGGCIGSLTGGVFGFMDSMRTAGESNVLANSSNMAKGKYLLQGTTRSATLFGVFFGGFHVVKYGVKVASDPGDAVEIAVAGAASIGALLYKPAYRASMPYAIMLIFMDGINVMVRKSS